MTYTAATPDQLTQNAPATHPTQNAPATHPTPEAAASACLNVHPVAYVFNAQGHLTAIYSGTPDQLHAHPIPTRPMQA